MLLAYASRYTCACNTTIWPIQLFVMEKSVNWLRTSLSLSIWSFRTFAVVKKVVTSEIHTDKRLEAVSPMVLKLEGNSEFDAYAWKYVFSEKNSPICDCSRTNQMP